MLEDTYAHSPVKKMFDQADVYGVGYDAQRAGLRPLRLGLIGLGGVAVSKHIPAIERLQTIWEPVTLAAVSCRRERNGRLAEKMHGCKWYADYREMLDHEALDGVIITSPDQLHYEHGMECLRRGLHILIEKPLTTDLQQAKALCDEAEKRGLVFMTVANKRYAPPYLRAKKAGIERPAMFAAKFNLGYDYVNLLEGGTVHIFDLARYFMGDVKAVSAIATHRYQFNKTGYPFDNACINLEFADGAIGQIYTSATALSLKPWERVEIYGEKHWLAVEDQRKLIVYDSEEGPAKVFEPVFPNTLIFDEEFGGYMGMIDNFLCSIRGTEKPLATGYDGLKALELILAVHQSIREQKRVELPLI